MQRLIAWGRDLFWLAVTVGIVAGGYLGFQTLGALREPVVAAPVERVAPVVSVASFAAQTDPLPIRGQGFVTAAEEVGIAAQVTGRLDHLHPAIAARGRVQAGEVLARLDDRVARAALDRAISDIRSTEANLALTRTQRERAETLFRRGVIAQENLDEAQSRETQLAATLESLRAAKESAEIQLDQTEIRAPFDGRVRSRSAALGDVVSPGQAIATLYTDRALEVDVALSEREAALIPGLFKGQAAAATVTAQFAGQPVAWEGQVARVDPALNPQTRTLTVTVALDDPGAGQTAAAQPAGAPPALINAFVDVTIDGARMAALYAVPSTSIRTGSTVWVADADDRLRILPVEPVHIDGATTFVRLGFEPDGQRLVTSGLAAPVEGMDLRTEPAPVTTAALAE